jgi:hypothetical protein
MHWNIMSTTISAVQASLAPVLSFSEAHALRFMLISAIGGPLLVLFKPILLGLLRALVLLVKPKYSKEERLARAQYATRWP